MTKQYGFVVDVSRCTGCKTCVVACKDAHNLPVGMNFRSGWRLASGSHDWRMASGRPRLVRFDFVQPLRRSRLREGLPDQSAL